MNLIISSWPGAGGSTISMILALELKLKYIYAGGVLKAWAKKMGYDPQSNSFHKWEELYGESWDYFWEDYILAKFNHGTQLLCEGKTAGFLLPEGKAYEIMVIADVDTRSKRAGLDGRTESISARDELLQERWKELFNIDLFDLEKIKENYDLVLDNANLTIFESLKVIFSKLNHEILEDRLTEIDKKFWAEGKPYLKQELIESDLLLTPEKIFRDWQENYKEKLEALPEKMRIAIAA